MKTEIKKESQAKIVATIGPASRSIEVLTKLAEVGVDVFRLNLSHDTHDTHAEAIRNIKTVREKTGKNISILGDLQGPKLRVGVMKNNGVILQNGQEFNLTTNNCEGDETRAYMNYLDLPKSVSVGDMILIDDGKIKLEVLSTNSKDNVVTKVINGGILSSRKGVNLPNTRVDLPCLTDKDLKDLAFAVEQGMDWIALSFVRKDSDIRELCEHIKQHNSHLKIVAKIEKPEALLYLDQIIHATDAVMVARGDLGVEMSFEKVPLIQKEIVAKCLDAAKPVIIATQMMESMITNFSPTRAEANDVANAVLEGADAMMLSAETSVGQFPVEAVEAMQKILTWTEWKEPLQIPMHPPIDKGRGHGYLSKSVCFNAATMARQVDAKAIIIFANSDIPVRWVSSFRANAKIIVYTTKPELLRTLPLVWGVDVYLYPQLSSVLDAVNYAKHHILEEKLLDEGCKVVYVGSIPFTHNRANMVRLGRMEIN
ncbi:MAG: pyruvate kinase [Bacteroidales bacterium]|jgi:pyruvate kinase|nr:pyruvate kinase [Bacteroidales bacterium]